MKFYVKDLINLCDVYLEIVARINSGTLSDNFCSISELISFETVWNTCYVSIFYFRRVYFRNLLARTILIAAGISGRLARPGTR